MPGWINPANFCTSVRLVLAPFVIAAILGRKHDEALALFAVAAATDALDGALARHYGWSTKAGQYLDPIADRMLLSGAYLAFAAIGSLPWWLVGLVFGRDIFILSAAAWVMLSRRTRDLTPSVWGKVSTLFQAITASVWMVRNAWETPGIQAAAAALIWPTAALTLWSGVHYGWRGRRGARAD
jgi:cardiolipin synthase